MLRSSTSSSDRPPRRWRTFAVIVLAFLAAAEAVLHMPEVRSALPPRTHYYHPAIARRLDALDRVLRVHGRVDVLFVGSSIVLTNVHPLLFDSLAAPESGRLVSFNAALVGLWPTSVHLYTEHLWLRSARPLVVVQGVRYAELAATTHAKNETQVWTGRIEPSWRDADLMTRASAAAVSRVTLLQYHGSLTRVMQRFKDGWTGLADSEDEVGYALRGYAPRGAPQEPAHRWEADLPNHGTCAAGRCAVGFAALRRTHAAVRRAGAAYVLVNVPEHAARWQGHEAVGRYRHYVESMRSFAAAEGIAFVDPTEGDPFRFANTPYYDLAHMTAAGSRQFTRELAGRMVPILDRTLASAFRMRAERQRTAIPASGVGRRGPG